MLRISPDVLAGAEAEVDRATAEWDAAFAAAMADGAHLAPRLEAAERRLEAALARWNDLLLVWARAALPPATEARDAA
jgi:hypothetical protein